MADENTTPVTTDATDAESKPKRRRRKESDHVPIWEGKEAREANWDIAQTCENLAYKEARRLTSDPHEVDELVQEAFLSLFSAGRRFDPLLGNKYTTTAFTWVRRHVKQAWDKRFKRGLTGVIDPDTVPLLFEESVVGGLTQDYDDTLSMVDSGEPEPSEVVESMEYFDQLPTEPKWLRKLAYMRYTEGLTDKEIRKRMGISQSKMAERMARLQSELEIIFGVGKGTSSSPSPDVCVIDQSKAKRLTPSRWSSILNLLPESPSYLRQIAVLYHRECEPVGKISEDLALPESKVKNIIEKIEEFWKESKIAMNWLQKTSRRNRQSGDTGPESLNDHELDQFNRLESYRIDDAGGIRVMELYVKFRNNEDSPWFKIDAIDYRDKDHLTIYSISPSGFRNEWKTKLADIVLLTQKEIEEHGEEERIR